MTRASSPQHVSSDGLLFKPSLTPADATDARGAKAGSAILLERQIAEILS